MHPAICHRIYHGNQLRPLEEAAISSIAAPDAPTRTIDKLIASAGLFSAS